MRHFLSLLTIAIVPLLGACDNILMCDRAGVVSLSIEIVDATTGLPALAGATVVVRDGEFVDSTTMPVTADVDSWAAGWERPGTYDVTIRKPGYQDWHRNGVRVREDRNFGACGDSVHGVRLRAELVPIAAT